MLHKQQPAAGLPQLTAFMHSHTLLDIHQQMLHTAATHYLPCLIVTEQAQQKSSPGEFKWYHCTPLHLIFAQSWAEVLGLYATS